MQVVFNGVNLQDSPSSLMELMISKELNHKSGIAVAVNHEVIAKSNWEDHILNENDDIIVITAAAGG
jgi:sulfur carrier protein